MLRQFLFGFLAWWFDWLWRWYIERLVCLHFCKFKEAGSDFSYTHVHIIGRNSRNITGVGHDDNVANDAPGKETVSDDHGEITVGPGQYGVGGLPHPGRAFLQVDFTEAVGDQCPPRFTRLRCKCPTEDGEVDVWVCYTLDRPFYDAWRQGQKYPDRTGNSLPSTNVRSVTDTNPGILDCEETFVIEAVEWERVPSCDNHSGPNAGENSTVQAARALLQTAYEEIGCGAGCNKNYTETFKGWRCESTSFPNIFNAYAIVQWTVTCEKP